MTTTPNPARFGAPRQPTPTPSLGDAIGTAFLVLVVLVVLSAVLSFGIGAAVALAFGLPILQAAALSFLGLVVAGVLVISR